MHRLKSVPPMQEDTEWRYDKCSIDLGLGAMLPIIALIWAYLARRQRLAHDD